MDPVGLLVVLGVLVGLPLLCIGAYLGALFIWGQVAGRHVRLGAAAQSAHSRIDTDMVLLGVLVAALLLGAPLLYFTLA